MVNIPNHIAFIVDGNRRWARERGLPTLEGHRRGFNVMKRVVGWCMKRGVNILTFYIFSTENWNRSPEEVDYLMNRLFTGLFAVDIRGLHKRGIKVLASGQRKRLPEALRIHVQEAEELTKNNVKGTVVFALSYGGRGEIVDAVRRIVKNKTPLSKIDEGLIQKNLYTPDIPYPDLVIRTSEQRLSNFLLWQSAYSELRFLKKYWPDFKEENLERILKEYSNRERRFGG